MESLEEKPEGDQPTGGQATVNWKPLTRNQRRVVGVLVEKSKTTPDVYPHVTQRSQNRAVTRKVTAVHNWTCRKTK